MPNTEPDTAPVITSTVTHVAVAVLVKDRHILLSKRAEHVHQGGLWEFPGGKVESDENVEQALSREIKEELGLQINSTRPLIKLIHHYPGKSVLLETLLVSQFEGRQYSLDNALEQYGLEGQKVKWVKLEELDAYQFPRANRPIISALRLPDSYLISPDRFTAGADSQTVKQFLADFSQSCQYYEVIQLRIKSLVYEQLNKVLKQSLQIAQQHQVRVLLNSSMTIDDALQQSSSGIHLSARHLHDAAFVENYRAQFADKMIAASCHCLEDIERANELELDFIVLSPVKQTASHPEQEPIGWLNFKKLTNEAKIPVFALGGMQARDIKQAHSCGAQGIAGISSMWKSVN